MIIFLAGPIYGKINQFIEKVEETEIKLKTKADYILQVGNLGCFPDPFNMDRAMRTHAGVGDFPNLYVQQAPMPRPTIFISGKHEDHTWMESMLSRSRTELIPNLFWLLNGYSIDLGFGANKVSVVGLGKVFNPTTYNKGRGNSKKRLAHYTRSEVEKACSFGPHDLLICHEPPSSEGISHIISATRPKLVVHPKRSFSKPSNCLTSVIALGELEIIPVCMTNDSFAILPID